MKHQKYLDVHHYKKGPEWPVAYRCVKCKLLFVCKLIRDHLQIPGPMSEAFSSVEPITRNRMIPEILRVNHRHTHTETIPLRIQLSNKPSIRVETEEIIESLRFWGRVLNRWGCVTNRHQSPSLRILCQDTDRCSVHAAFITLQLSTSSCFPVYIYLPKKWDSKCLFRR